MRGEQYDLPAYIDHLASWIGQLSLVVCLDPASANHDQPWSTHRLRGLDGNLEVSLLTEGVPRGMHRRRRRERVCRAAAPDRPEDSHTGRSNAALATQIPKQRIMQAERTAQVIGDEVWNKFRCNPVSSPSCATTSSRSSTARGDRGSRSPARDGWPAIGNAGNVLRPTTNLKPRSASSARRCKAAGQAVSSSSSNSPYGAKVTFSDIGANAGWDAPEMAPWLDQGARCGVEAALRQAIVYMGEAGRFRSCTCSAKIPKAQFCITGVLGPGSTRTGQQFLHLPPLASSRVCRHGPPSTPSSSSTHRRRSRAAHYACRLSAEGPGTCAGEPLADDSSSTSGASLVGHRPGERLPGSGLVRGAAITACIHQGAPNMITTDKKTTIEA
jgi:hypothetical protein